MARIVSLTGGSPWGITLSGGKDFGAHLQVSKVSRCSQKFALYTSAVWTLLIFEEETKYLSKEIGHSCTPM